MKQKPSKLDPFAESLDDWSEKKMGLEEMQAQLAQDGCSISLSRLSDWLSARRSEKLQDKLLANITSGAQQCKDLDKAYAENPEPKMELLIRLLKTHIMLLSTKAQENPDLLTLVSSMTKTVMDFLSGQTKARIEEAKLAQGERKLKLMEKKAAAYDLAKAEMEKPGGLTPETLKRIEKELKLF